MRVLLNAFQCNSKGVSEGYLAYKWIEGLSKKVDLSLISGDIQDFKDLNVTKYSPMKKWELKFKSLEKLNSALKIDYFIFNYLSKYKLKDVVKEFDIVHHVSPVAPRYPVSISKFAKHFVIGPIAGGLRVPPAFRSEVEAAEDLFLKLRNIDKYRLKYDKSLLSTFENAEKIIVCGDYLKDILPSKFHNKFTLLLDVGIDIDQYTFKKRDFSQNNLNLLYVGRVVPYKGLEYLIRSIARLPQHVKKDIRLDIAGNQNNNSYETCCKQLCIDLGIDKNIKFHGFLSKEKVKGLYAKARVFCFPSIAEAGGTVVLEAMACGLPILAVKYGGPAISVGTDCGILIDPKSPEQLIDEMSFEISNLHSNTTLLKKMGYTARAHAEAKHDWKKRVDFMERLYRSII